MKNKLITNTLIIMTLILFPVAGNADLIGIDFFRISNNNVENVAGQFSATVYDEAGAEFEFPAVDIMGNEVLFVFRNSATIKSNIAEIYFDDGTLFGQTRFINSLGGFTDFSNLGPSGNFPEGQNVSPIFVPSAGFGADVDPGNPDLGINTAADALGIVIQLLPDLDLSNVQSALQTGALRIGLHVRSIGIDDGSDSFMNTVPEPATMLLLGTGLIGLAGIGRKKFFKK